MYIIKGEEGLLVRAILLINKDFLLFKKQIQLRIDIKLLQKLVEEHLEKYTKLMIIRKIKMLL